MSLLLDLMKPNEGADCVDGERKNDAMRSDDDDWDDAHLDGNAFFWMILSLE